ncbi:arad-like aldolase/epimerase [Polyplosphaeria fusca]|uniref:Arad-like aldolase/epimerase n=1 Tax=Polyplosphaeria fusca TaxID=682080 RepID=A0A9P4R1Z3_9PLEO|nr:arad-like aldolase/epimerase [Polyplosphaeria fusca]
MDDPSTFPPELQSQLGLLIASNHILHEHSLVDAFGHISIRHPTNPSQYIIAGYDPGAPALMSSSRDFITYHVSDSSPVHPNAPKGYSERFIHGEIFRVHPKVNCVVHSHSDAVLPFTATGMPLRPIYHMAGFLAKHGKTLPPHFIIDGAYAMCAGKHTPDMLIRDALLGTMLALQLKVPEGEEVDGDEEPYLPVVLQPKHGFTCVGSSIQRAVYRAIYTQKNCELVKSALDAAGGKEIEYLSAREAQACAKMNVLCEDKAFRLWLREVEVNPLYRNEEGVPRDLPVGGMGV